MKEVWDELAELMDDAVMPVKHEPIWHGRNAKPCYLEVRASVGTLIQDVLKIANAFLEVVDVECYHPDKGTMRWHPERGEPFEESEWDHAQEMQQMNVPHGFDGSVRTEGGEGDEHAN